jgi:predicted transcriptional regulator
MSTTAPTKRPRWTRLAQDAKLIPVERVQEWYSRAILTPGLRELDRTILAAIAEWYHRLQARDYVGSLSYQRLAERLHTDAVNARWAVERLVELGLVAVKPGAGGRANTYLPALPKRIAASMLTAAVEPAYVVPPF